MNAHVCPCLCTRIRAYKYRNLLVFIFHCLFFFFFYTCTFLFHKIHFDTLIQLDSIPRGCKLNHARISSLVQKKKKKDSEVYTEEILGDRALYSDHDVSFDRFGKGICGLSL